jgi:hypothetical protein
METLAVLATLCSPSAFSYFQLLPSHILPTLRTGTCNCSPNIRLLSQSTSSHLLHVLLTIINSPDPPIQKPPRICSSLPLSTSSQRTREFPLESPHAFIASNRKIHLFTPNPHFLVFFAINSPRFPRSLHVQNQKPPNFLLFLSKIPNFCIQFSSPSMPRKRNL